MVQLQNLSYDELKLKALQRATAYLYADPKPISPLLIQRRDADSIICNDGLPHSFILEETRFGKAMVITWICACSYCEAEIFPPNENRGLKKQ